MLRRPPRFHLGYLLCTASLALLLTPASSGQEPAQVPSSLPFVGCPSDGQLGPQQPPNKPPRHLSLPPTVANHLAYYQGFDGPGVLGPRGWYCFEAYGSNGTTLYISPTPLNPKQFFDSNWKGFSGPVLQISSMVGDTSGRFAVAKVITRVFPAHRDFANNVISEGLEPEVGFPFGPYPEDRLIYKSKELVEFITPANRKGLGTESWLLPNQQPILGVAILTGEGLSLTQLSLRLPPGMDDLAPIIIRETEREKH